MENWLRLYGAQIVASMKVEFEYRVAVMIWLVSLFVEPLVYIGVWSAIARMQGGTVGGYTPQQFAAYYLAYLSCLCGRPPPRRIQSTSPGASSTGR